MHRDASTHDGRAAPQNEGGLSDAHGAFPTDDVLARLPEMSDPAPFYLSETGLYRDIASKELHAAAVEYSPAFALWSDGSEKRRWLILPQSKTIDTRDEGLWKFPVGTLVFKEFRAGGKRIETRLLARTGEDDDAMWMGSFVWNGDESDARFEANGATDVRGTQHDVPAVRSCGTCHRGDPTRFLGLSAVQAPRLPRALLSTPPDVHFVPPGNAIEAAALGYMHGNCAHCHNPNGSARPDTDLDLRLGLSDRDPRDTLAYRTTIDVPLQYFDAPEGARRVVPGDPESSAVLLRMRERGDKTQMPPLGSEAADPQGIAIIEAWIPQL